MGKQRAIRPTRRQKEIIRANRLAPENWLVIKEDGGILNIVHKVSKKMRELKI